MNLSISRNQTGYTLCALFALVGIEILDISIAKIYLFVSSIQFSLLWNYVGFISIISVYILGQHYILKYVKVREQTHKRTHISHISSIHKIVKLIQYALVSILIIVTIQMVVTSSYNSRLLLCSLWLSYSLAVSMLGILVTRFFYWFIFTKNIVVLCYGMAFTAIAIELGTGLFLNTALLIGQEVNTQQIAGSESPSLPDNLLPLNFAFVISSIVSFLLTWAATVLVLHHYSFRLGKIKYWIIVSIPLLYFLTQFEPIFLFILSSYSQPNPISFAIVYTIIFSISKPVGGLLFGVAFWTIARKVGHQQLRDFLIISAYGLVLIFGSDQAVILSNRPYPPFGMATISFLGLSAYLVLVGIYSSAISISEDSKLRQSIRSFAVKESRFLESIGSAHMTEEVRNRVLTLTKLYKVQLAEESGIQTSVTDDEMKEYLDQVLQEVKTVRLTKDDDKDSDHKSSNDS